MLKKVIVWGGVAFLAFFVAFGSRAADVIAAWGNVAVEIFLGVGDFFTPWLVRF